MTKFADKYGTTNRQGTSPITSTPGRTAVNHSGATAYSRDAKNELFLLGVMNFVSEDTFYESGDARDNRFVKLVHQVTAEDPDWVQRFIPWLRDEANMRSASVVVACEYVKAGGPNARQVIASACSRADEPAEVLAYWTGVYGRPIPSSVKRGVADAARRLYNEYSTAKYDGGSKAFRFGDVIQLTHAKPSERGGWQDALYKYTLDSRYGNEPVLEQLPMLALRKKINSGEITRDQLLADPELMKSAGMTWESLSGLGPMDAAAWEAVIPNMGYMALLRNLRNFEQAGISAKAVAYVQAYLTNPENVAKSRQFPFRFWSAYKNTLGLKFASSVETALDLSLQNLPTFGGRTLIVADTSGSMGATLSAKSQMTRLEAAALFAVALALKGEKVDLYGFADYTFEHKISKGSSVLREMQKFVGRVGEAGYGTDIPGAVGQWDGHNRVFIFSDMQTNAHYDRGSLRAIDRRSGYYGSPRGTGLEVKNTQVPASVPIYGFNLAGYRTTEIGDPGKNEFEFGGLTDHTFKLIPILEQRGRGQYPF